MSQSDDSLGCFFLTVINSFWTKVFTSYVAIFGDYFNVINPICLWRITPRFHINDNDTSNIFAFIPATCMPFLFLMILLVLIIDINFNNCLNYIIIIILLKVIRILPNKHDFGCIYISQTQFHFCFDKWLIRFHFRDTDIYYFKAVWLNSFYWWIFF